MRFRLLIVLSLAASIFFMMVGSAWAGCSNPCPPRQHCIQVCMPEFW